MPEAVTNASPDDRGSTPALVVAGFAAALASMCCVAPLVLAVIGMSGAWIGQLRWFAPYSTPLSALSVAALILAGWKLFRGNACATRSCEPHAAECDRANVRTRRWFWAVALLVLVPVLVPLAAPFFY